MRKLIGNLVVIAITKHVVLQDGATESSQSDTTGLDGIASRFEHRFGPLLDLILDARLTCIVEARLIPMPVWAQHSGPLSAPALGAVETSGEEKSRACFEVNFLDRKIAAIDLTMDDRMKGSPVGLGEQAHRHLEGMTEFLRSLGPLLLRGRRRERKVAIQILEISEALVVRQLALR